MLWPEDAMDQIRNDENKRSLESMMTDRKASRGRGGTVNHGAQ